MDDPNAEDRYQALERFGRPAIVIAEIMGGVVSRWFTDKRLTFWSLENVIRF